jgi:hypothetical protein
LELLLEFLTAFANDDFEYADDLVLCFYQVKHFEYFAEAIENYTILFIPDLVELQAETTQVEEQHGKNRVLLFNQLAQTSSQVLAGFQCD